MGLSQGFANERVMRSAESYLVAARFLFNKTFCRLSFRLYSRSFDTMRLAMHIVLRKFLVTLLLAGITVAAQANPEQITQPTARQFTFEYKTVVESPEAGMGPVQLFIPLAVVSEQQQLVAEKIVASIDGTIETEDKYGNRYWHGTLERSKGEPIVVTITSTVKRYASVVASPDVSGRITEQEKITMAKYLGANAKVVVDHPVLEPILAEIRQHAASDDPAVVARAIYDWVVNNLEYKKVGTGWGNGDTFWACSERYGNCTDFHALFISLARSNNIPARFEIGFPVPNDRDSGKIGGYHCWVEFYLPTIGWFPIDASEAFKHPEKKEYYYGTHPEDRIHFSTGRDLKLGNSHKDQPLNYFVYPYIEVNGKKYEGKVSNAFSYKNDTHVSSPARSLD